jgi:hypothetical protein
MTTKQKLLTLASVLAGLAMLGMTQDTQRQSSLTNSIGLECEVYLVVPHTRDKFTARSTDGLRTRDEIPHKIEGVLSGVAEKSITIRKNEKAYWINMDSVAVVEFVR